MPPPSNLPVQPPRPPTLPPPAASIVAPPRPSSPPPAPREAPVVASVSVPRPPPSALPPIPQTKAEPVPPVAVSSQLRTMAADIASMKTGQAPQGVPVPTRVLPQGPIEPAPSVAPQQQPSSPISIPAATDSGTSSGRKVLYAVLGILILGGIAYSLASMLSSPKTPEPTVSVSPRATSTLTASPSPSPTITIRSLRSYFGNLGRIIVVKDTATAVTDMRSGLASIQPTRKVAAAISVMKDGKNLDAQALVAHLLPATPPSVKSLFGEEFLVLVYGQSEQFDTAGVRTEAPSPAPKVVFLFEIANASAASQALRSWEDTGLDTTQATLFGYTVTQRSVPGFHEGVYRTITVRYANFPYADKSIDYAIVTASNNKNYLVLSASRESLFAIVDKLVQ